MLFSHVSHIIALTEPNAPLHDADHVGSFDFKEVTAMLIYPLTAKRVVVRLHAKPV